MKLSKTTELIQVTPYDLPDAKLFEGENPKSGFMVWTPESACIVLGQSNNPQDSLEEMLVLEDGITVTKRPSGGETVILTPKMLIISVLILTEKLDNPHQYFKKVNGCIIRALEAAGIKSLGQKGISDITIGNRKILGSSIYRKKERLLYHAVLNIAESPEFIAHYLKHPRKEPDYRQGRDHKEFVTSLLEAGYNKTADEYRYHIETALHSEFHMNS